jgi:predicted butyrate kinase (DUF1464 family)
MSDDSEFLRRRLDAIQTELGTMRFRDEQREAAYQSQTQTLTRQIVEIAASLDRHLVEMSARIDALAERFEERMDRIEEMIKH